MRIVLEAPLRGRQRGAHSGRRRRPRRPRRPPPAASRGEGRSWRKTVTGSSIGRVTSEDAISAAVERLAVARRPGSRARRCATSSAPTTWRRRTPCSRAWCSGGSPTGATVVGRKIGATSEAVQDSSASTSPTSATCSTTWTSATSTPISMQTLLQPRVEAEVAFLLATDVDPADEADITIELVRERGRGRAAGARDRRLADRELGHRVHRHRRRQRVQRALRRRRARASRSTSSSLRDVDDVADASTARSGPPATAPPAWATRSRRCAGWPCSATASATRSGPARWSCPARWAAFVPFAAGDKVEASISGFEPLVVEFEE